MAPQHPLRIHDAAHADLETLQRIGCDTYREHFSGIWTRAGMQRFLSVDFSSENLASSLAATDQHLWLLAEDAAGNTQGFAKLNWNSRMPLHNAVGAELQKIYLLLTLRFPCLRRNPIQYRPARYWHAGNDLQPQVPPASAPDNLQLRCALFCASLGACRKLRKWLCLHPRS